MPSRSSASGTSSVARAPNAFWITARLDSNTCDAASAPDNSRANSYSARTRRSRCAATRAWKRRPAVRCPVIRPTASITENVMRYCTSLTAKSKRGGTKKKSKLATPTQVAVTDGARPKRMATSSTTSRNNMTILARSSHGRSGVATTAMRRHAPPANTCGSNGWPGGGVAAAAVATVAPLAAGGTAGCPISIRSTPGASRARRRAVRRRHGQREPSRPSAMRDRLWSRA